MGWEEWEGMTKFQSVRRGVFSFEEVPLVVVAGLAIEFTKNRAISSYWLWEKVMAVGVWQMGRKRCWDG